MAYIVIAMFLPAAYITYLTYRWLYRRSVSKKDRIHFTKKAVWLILLSFILIYLSHRIAYGVWSSPKSQSFYLFSIIYFLAAAIIAAYLYLVVRATKSRKNLTKLLISFSFLLLYLPMAWWSYQVISVGVYEGDFGINKKQAIASADEFIGSRVNHSFSKAELKNGYWLVGETLRTFDSKVSAEVNYKVDIKTGKTIFEHSDKLVTANVTRANGSGDSLEMMVFVDHSTDPKKPELESLQYANTDNNGSVSLNMRAGTELKYYLQVRDCSLACQSFVFRLKAPIKEKYDIVINQFQPMTEI